MARNRRAKHGTIAAFVLLASIAASAVSILGADGTSALPPARFTYTLSDPPASISASAGLIGSTNTPIHVMDNGAVDLVDLNGDALPDLLETPPYGSPHVAYLNRGAQGSPQSIVWSDPIPVEGDARASNISLAETTGAIAHLADLDGDGLADLVYKTDTEVYYFPNKPTPGHVRWDTRLRMNLNPMASLPPSPYGVENVKSADLDFDKRMDIIQSVSVGWGASYRCWFNSGGQSFSQAVTVSQDSGYMLSDTGVHIADLNGDRVPDIARIRPAGIEVTAGLGYGRFLPLVTIPLPDYTLTSEQVEKARLEDVSGDGLADLVLERAQPGQLWYWLNRGTYALDNRRIITGMSTQYGVNTATRWADMNGNGSTDLVYADAAAAPRLQIIDVGLLIGCVPSPNLLTSMDNGIGRITTLTYDTSTRFVVEDGQDWPDPLPFPIELVSQVSVADSMGHTYQSQLAYHEGYYDPVEHEFRGFAQAEQWDIGDASAPTQVSRFVFDTGRTIEAMKGKVLRETAEDENGGVFWEEETSWIAEPPLLTGADGRTVTFAHPASRTRRVLERGNGTPVELTWAYEYDDYGNMTRLMENGRSDGSWGDERVTDTTYTSGGAEGRAAWILNAVVEKSTSTLNGTLAARTRNYYDGNTDPFKISRGNLTKSENWVADTIYVTAARSDYDTYGNLIAAYDPLYGTQPGHYREFVYDPDLHVLPVREIIHTGTRDLVMEAAYDYGLGVLTSMLDVNGYQTTYAYDAFGRITEIHKPLDPPPSIAFEYALSQTVDGGGIVNYIETRQRDGSAGDGFLHSRTYFDGMGRTLMTRSEDEDPARVVVKDVADFNAHGLPWRSFLPYFETATLDYSPPVATGFFEHVYDALGRETRTIQPDGSFAAIEYAPLTKTVRDEEQTQTDSPYSGCGMRYVEDALFDDKGNGRLREVYEIVRLDAQGNATASPNEWLTQYRYDVLGNFTGYTDSLGNQKEVAYDGLGRTTFMHDPDRGYLWYAYDDAANLLRTRDAKGQEIAYAYDGANRLVAEYYTAEAEELGGGLAPGARWALAPDTVPSRTPEVEYHYDAPFGPLDYGDLWTPSQADRIVETLLDPGLVPDIQNDLTGDGMLDVADAILAQRAGNPGSPLSPTVAAENTLGRLAWVHDQSGEEHTSYDAHGRAEWTIKRIIDTGPGDLRNFYTAQEYDAMDRVTRLTYPDQTYVTYAYNARGLLESIPNVITGCDYNPAGQDAQLALACGVATNYSYDNRLRLARIHSLRDRDGLALQDLNYVYDRTSNITQIVDGRTEATLDTIGRELGILSAEARKFNATQSFAYDSLYRLTQASNPAVYGSLNWRYNPIGNMLRQDAALTDPDPLLDLGTMTYGSNAGPHALTATEKGPTAPMTFAYDANGNMLNARNMTMTWDHNDRLTGIVKETTSADYIYDYTGMRKRKTVVNNGQTSQTLYVNDGSELREKQYARFVQARGRHTACSYKLITMETGLVPEGFFLYDHLGSRVMTLGENGTPTDLVMYYPFGYIRNRHYSTHNIHAYYSFCEKEEDTESLFFYFENRYLSPATGRFLSVDPLITSNTPEWLPNPQRINPYSYTINRPLIFKDPNGMDLYPLLPPEDQQLADKAKARFYRNLNKKFEDKRDNLILNNHEWCALAVITFQELLIPKNDMEVIITLFGGKIWSKALSPLTKVLKPIMKLSTDEAMEDIAKNISK